MNRINRILFSLSAFLLAIPVWAQQRFPKPEFESGYVQPPTTQPAPRALFLEYFDVFVLTMALFVATWFVFKKRSRQGVFWTSVFSLLYFGFYREGCICSIGSIQNIVLAIFDPTYVLPLTALLFFVIPLIVSLFYGRTFCAGVCPLGAIQDLVAFRPIELPKWLQKILGMNPILISGHGCFVCRNKIRIPDLPVRSVRGHLSLRCRIPNVIGALFLMVGVFVARPYCRFFCPYGVLLGWMSTFSKKHLTITPSNCIQCKLCANSCPFGAIEEPVEELGNRRSNIQILMIYLFFVPLWIGIGGWTGSMVHVPLSKFNKTVYLSEQLVAHPEIRQDQDNIDVQSFMQSGKTMGQLVAEAKAIRRQFYWGSWLLGGFMGLVIGLTLVKLATHRNRKDYVPDKTNCLSCGRCMDYCPVKS